MPLEPEHIEKFLEDDGDAKFKSELLELLRRRIDNLCFKECEIDRIQCTLTPLCTHRTLLKLRLLNGLTIEDQPKFCYSVHKNIIFRDFRNKTVIYKPNDAYLYLVDFFDVFFHGDYRKLNKHFSKKEFKDASKIFDDRINNREEDFQYRLSKDQNFMIFKYEDKIHVCFINENYVLCNANRENITNLELLLCLCNLFKTIYFPEVNLRLNDSNCVEITILIPKDALLKIGNSPPTEDGSKRDEYLWNVFYEELDALSQFCKEINIFMDKKENLAIKLNIGVMPEVRMNEKSDATLRYRDLRLIFNILFRLYNDFYILHV
ncbi:MAG: hypothetical protein EAX91_09885 [Candidatus Lokiarchaeota archaeon]|nr:hypothetical protein [Candidatus Lokiarchaeota archaeon]